MRPLSGVTRLSLISVQKVSTFSLTTKNLCSGKEKESVRTIKRAVPKTSSKRTAELLLQVLGSKCGLQDKHDVAESLLQRGVDEAIVYVQGVRTFEESSRKKLKLTSQHSLLCLHEFAQHVDFLGHLVEPSFVNLERLFKACLAAFQFHRSHVGLHFAKLTRKQR